MRVTSGSAFSLVLAVGIALAGPAIAQTESEPATPASAPAQLQFDLAMEAYQRRDYATAAATLRPLAEDGNPQAQLQLGRMHVLGLGVPQDYATAVDWFRKAKKLGNAEAAQALSFMYSKGIAARTPQEIEKMQSLLEAADRGDLEMLDALASLFGIGDGRSTSVEAYRLRADQGDAEAQFLLGFWQLYGLWDLPQRPAEGLRLLKQAASQGHPEAMYRIGQLYTDDGTFYIGEGTLLPNDGTLYADGRVVALDYAKAAEWFRKAAELGANEAQRELGALYAAGQGVPKDRNQAFKLYSIYVARPTSDHHFREMVVDDLAELTARMSHKERAEARAALQTEAEGGSAAAKAALGWAYWRGVGFSRDKAMAMSWYERAANQGDTETQYYLGYLYAEGEDWAHDYVQAYKWLTLMAAGEKFEPFDNDLLKAALGSRVELAAKMTSDEIEEALKLANAWRPIQENSE